MKIAVTGASGHVGVNLCRKLLESGHEVRALTHRHFHSLQHLDIIKVPGDLLDQESLVRLVSGVDAVFHLAARISIRGDRDGMVRAINETGTRKMLEVSARAGVSRFIHFSSIHAFRQEPLDEILDESRPVVETGFSYDISKAAGEKAVNEYAGKGLHAVILCPTAIIGPADPQPSLTGNAVIQLYNNNIPALVPGGYNWVDVRDVVDSAIQALTTGRAGEKYLIAGHYHSLRELSALIGLVTSRKTVKMVLPMWIAGLGLPFISLYSRFSGNEPLYTSESLEIVSKGNKNIIFHKAAAELGHHPRPLKETIYDLIDWFRSQKYIK